MSQIENWDDDDLDFEGNDFAFRSASIATSMATALSNRRGSMSSHISARSDMESNNGDEERQVNVLGDDERSRNDAIAAANLAGIPIPHNVPNSALIGGTIKRLGGRKITKTIQDDWDDGDLEFSADSELKIKIHEDTSFPESLRQVSGPSSTQSSPSRQRMSALGSCYDPHLRLRSSQALNTLLNQYKDGEDKDYTRKNMIKISKNRKNPRLIPITTSPTLYRRQQAVEFEDFEQDFQLPQDDAPLRLSLKIDMPMTPNSIQDESDEWGEGGSLGTRHGGKRDRTSNRGSSVTAMSPSVSSSLTLESEDEGLDGLLIPNDPIQFREILKKKHGHTSFQNIKGNLPTSESKDDFFSGLDIGLGDIFDPTKLTMNRNVKVKTTRQASPARPKAAVSLTFTNRTNTSSNSRLPRPPGTYERIPSSLESVPESGGPILNRNHRFNSRPGGHSSNPSTSSITTPSTPSSSTIPPFTPRRRELVSKTSLNTLHQEPTTTSAQLLKVKRSMPIIRSYPSNVKSSTNQRYDKPPLYFDHYRPISFSRPKTPVEYKRGTETCHGSNKLHQTPFLPAGTSNTQSYNKLAKNSHNFKQQISEQPSNSSERQFSSRAVSRSTIRSSSPYRKGADALAREAITKRLLTKPVRGRDFGDGCELDAFDDLPTSRESEQNYIKEPVSRGPMRPNSCRKPIEQDMKVASINSSVPLTSKRSRDTLPRFARDTTASRLARENTLAQRVSLSKGLNSCKVRLNKPKKNQRLPQKPQLIKPLGNCNNPKSLKGMYYNPYTYRWEGNECDLSQFDLPSSPSTCSIPSSIAYKENRHNYREKETSTPRPALIQHVKSMHNVQVVGGMVFDPQRMCWLKISSQQRKDINSLDDIANSIDSFNDDEEDVFKDVPDLEESRACDPSTGGLKNDNYREDFLVGEEFDVGPEFIKRQREEEERWKRKLEKWIQAEFGIDRDNPDWRWVIRGMVLNHEL